jgi:protein-tyrosine-phosphatase
VCRSPAVAALISGPPLTVTSAGFLPGGRKAAAKVRRWMLRVHDIDLGQHRSQQVSAEMIQAADVMILMDRRNNIELWSSNLPIPQRRIRLDIKDPNWLAGDSKEFDAVMTEITLKARGLREALLS